VAPTNRSKLSFEQALEKLEKLVGLMEEGDIPLSDLLKQFEEGSALLKVCEARLKEAELKIEQLRETRDGAEVSAFEPDRT
jgi:exodeoxyribonuclease VII small subunit